MGQPGLRLHGEPRRGPCGVWRRATTARGRERGVLRLDPALVADPAAVERVAAGLAALRRLDAPGVMRAADLVTNRDRIWLITEAPAGPTAADLLGRADLGPAAVAVVATDVAGALVRLHEAGLAHGALTLDAVVVTGTGSAVLVEVGLLAALRGETPDPAADVAAWAELVRALAVAWAGAGSGAAGLFHAAAATAEARGLAAALDVMAEAVRTRPELERRYGLVSAVAGPADRTATQPAAGPDEEGDPPPDARTLLPADDATRPGRRASAPDDGATTGPGDAGIRLRFGPGVPPPRPRPVGRATPTAPPPRRRPGRTRRRAILSGLITLLLAVGVAGVLWWRQRDPLDILAADVTTLAATGGCDVTVDVVGTVRTNGRGGTFRYRWIRSDGGRSEVLEQSVAAGTGSAQVHLYWTFRGRGTYRATATLEVVAPTVSRASAEYIYAC